MVWVLKKPKTKQIHLEQVCEERGECKNEKGKRKLVCPV